jgi:hypothetical protein
VNADQLRHVLRAAASNTGEKVFVVIGSQAILGSHPDAPRTLRRSVESDTYPRQAPDKAILIDGAIGEGSPFHHEFGYYAHGVSPETATLPVGWEDRLVKFEVGDPAGTTGLCLEVHDLAFSKLAAGRDKDLEFVKELLKHRLINRGQVERLIESESRPQTKETLVRNWTISKTRLKAEQ